MVLLSPPKEISSPISPPFSPVAIKNTLKFGMYSFKAPSLDYYDAYSYMNGNGLGTLYGWSSTTANSNVKSGMFDSDSTTCCCYPCGRSCPAKPLR